jgi:hypothetical protein
LPKRLNSLFTEEAGASLVNVEVGRVGTSLFHRAVGPTDHAVEEQEKDKTVPFLLSRRLPKNNANRKKHCSQSLPQETEASRSLATGMTD